MSNFDYNRHTVVGELSINSNSGHGYVKVYGYMNGYTFIPLSLEESSRIFTPKGEVFAPKIARDYSNLDRKLIALSVKPNNNEGDNRDDFVCDYYNGEVRTIGYTIANLPKVGVIGEYNYMQLQEHHLLGKDEPVFFQVKDRLYYIKNDKQRLIPYCTITDSMPIVRGKYDTYYLGSSLPMEQGVIDITNDQQLIKWFVDNIAIVRWHDIQCGDGKLAQEAAKQALEATKNLSPDIVKHRLQRLATLTESFVLTRDEVQSLIDAPWLQPTIQKALVQFKEDYVNLVLSENADEINSIRKEHKIEIQREKAQHDSAIAQLKESMEKALQTHDNTMSQLGSTISAKRVELEALSNDIEEKRITINDLTKQLNEIIIRKDTIIADFDVIKQVLKLSANDSSISVPVKQYVAKGLRISEVGLSQNILPSYRGFKKNLEICLKSYGCKTDNINSLFEFLVRYDSLILPNMETLMSIIYATGQCRYIMSYVNVAWKSYDDLWNNGLSQIVDSCQNNPTVIHYLVLRNINLTYVPNYLQPLLDAQVGYSNILPNTDEPYPINLKVLMSATDDEVIPLTKDSLQFVGCISKQYFQSNTTIHKPEIEGLIGYLDADMLSGAKNDLGEFVEYNHIEDYIND